MKRFSAGIDIEAAPESVWGALVELANWPQFDPHTERIEGRAALGESVKVFSTLAPGRAFPFKVTAFEQPRVLTWTGGMPLGALKTVRTHTITPRNGGSRLEVEEVVSGPMLGAIANALPNLSALFADFCSGLKAHVEGTPAKGAHSVDAAATDAPQRLLRMTRRFRATPDRVFDAWIKPETASQWLFHMAGDEDYAAELDTRPGGQWTIRARRCGVDYVGEGHYLEIDRPRRLVFTFQMRQFSPNTDTITVELEADGDGCLLTLTQAGVDIAAELARVAAGEAGGTEKGWRAMLDGLAASLLEA